MKKKFYLIALLLTTTFAGAQSLAWGGRFGGDGEDVVLAMHTDAAGNTYTTGYFTNTADFDITNAEYLLTTNMDFNCFVQKTAPDGTLLWAKSMGGEAGDYGTKITTDNDGNVLLTGVFQMEADFDPGDGEFLLTSAGSLDIFIVKLNPDGELIWAEQFPGLEYEESNGIGTDNAGNVYISGYFYSELDFDPGNDEFLLTPEIGDGFLVKLKPDGSFIWAQKFGGEGFELATGMQTLPNGEVYISGNFEGTVDFDPSDEVASITADTNTSGIFLYHVDSDGKFINVTKVGQAVNAGYGLSVAVDSAGNAYVCGYIGGIGTFETAEGSVTMPLTDFLNGYVARVNTDGSVAWARQLSGTGVSTAYAAAVNSAGDLLLSGYFNGTMSPGAISLTEESVGDTESFVTKIDRHGNFLWARQLGGINTVDRCAMSVDADDNILLASAFEVSVDLDPGDGTLLAEPMDFRDNFLVKLTDDALSVPEYNQTSNLSLYPNPVQNVLHVSGIAATDTAVYVLYDTLGRTVKSGKLASGLIDMSGLQAGLYHLSAGGHTYKIVKQ